jgi:MFS family permease
VPNLEKISRKITLTLLASQSLFSAALIMSFTVGSIIVVELTGNSQWSGVPATLVLVGAASMAYPMGRFMDRFGRRPGLSLGFLIGVVGALLAGSAVILASLPLFLLGVLCLGLNRGANELGRYAAAEANPAHRRARAISMVVFGGTVGSIGGPLLVEWASRLAENFGLSSFSGPWFAASFFLALAVLNINLFLRPDPRTIAQQLSDSESQTTVERGPGRPYSQIWQHPLTKVATGAMIFGQLAMVSVMTITPVYMHGHQHALGAISWVIAAHTFGMYALSFVTGWLVDRLGQTRMIILGGFILALSCLLAPLWDHVAWLALSLFLLGLGWNFGFVAGSALLTSILSADEKGRVQGLTDAMVYISSGVGSIGSGFIFASFGFLPMSWLTILISLAPVILVMRFVGIRGRPAMAEAT